MRNLVAGGIRQAKYAEPGSDALCQGGHGLLDACPGGRCSVVRRAGGERVKFDTPYLYGHRLSMCVYVVCVKIDTATTPPPGEAGEGVGCRAAVARKNRTQFRV